MRFILPYKISMSDTDAAGVVYFARYYDILHLCYQEFMSKAGFALSDMIRQGEVVAPIIRSECDYKGPLYLDDRIIVQAACTKNGATSFTLAYEFIAEARDGKPYLGDAIAGKVVATAGTVHVFVDAATRQPTSLPAELKVELAQIQV